MTHDTARHCCQNQTRGQEEVKVHSWLSELNKSRLKTKVTHEKELQRTMS